MKLTDENSVVLASWTRPEAIYRVVRGLNKEGVTEIARSFRSEPFDQPSLIGWLFVKDGRFREILLVGNTPEKGDYPIMLFQHHPHYSWSFSPYKPWVSPTEQREATDEECKITSATVRYFLQTQSSSNRDLPTFAFDVSLHRMLGLQLPFWLPHDEFLIWLEEARSA